ncbi:MAG: hypothetical protein LBE99_03840, partial [Puniceicoccales bacterium]|nr:hypothetical protein [Puniceicoccales bacterium]
MKVFQFLFGTFLFCTKLVFACNFPVSITCPYESLPPHIRNLHARLFHAATLAGLNEGKDNEKNYFACALVVYFDDNTHIEVPINQKLSQRQPSAILSQHVPLYNENWWVFYNHVPPTQSKMDQQSHSALINLWQLIEECKTHPFDSSSRDLQADFANFHNLLANPKNFYIGLIDERGRTQYIPARGCRYPDADFSGFYSQNSAGKRTEYKPTFRLQSRFFQLLAKYFYHQPQGTQENVYDIKPQDIIRAADSEAWTILFLHAYRKKIGTLIREQQKGRKIVHIELHGHTTRDMCPFCFTHINLLQWLANNHPQGGHFFSDLRFQLDIDENIPVTTFISSAVSFPDSSMSWFKDFTTSQDCFRPQGVNQFRLLDNPPGREIPVPVANRFGALMPVFSLCGNHSLILGDDTKFPETQGSMLLNALDLKVYKNPSGDPRQFEAQTDIKEVPMYVYLYFPPSGTKMIWQRQDGLFSLPYVSSLLPTVSLNLPRIREFFTLRDVPHDGDCGAWAVLQGMNPDVDYLHERGARMQEMQDL